MNQVIKIDQIKNYNCYIIKLKVNLIVYNKSKRKLKIIHIITQLKISFIIIIMRV